MKRGKGFGVHPKQREKVKYLPCVYCGAMGTDPAHLWDRSRAGCDHEDGVVPLCRKHHDLYDRRELDLLPALIARGYWREMAHPIAVHFVSPLLLLARLTGRKVKLE